MKFDANRAWQQATAAVSANRDVLFPVAGVFFLLPAVATTYLLSDIQAQLMAKLGDSKALERIMAEHMGLFLSVGLVASLLQMIGFLAVLALLTDRKRPTVGEALKLSIAALPTVVAALALFLLAYILAATVFALLAGALAMIHPALSALPILALLAGVVCLMVKLSLTLPVIAIERNLNPVAALKRSWQLTTGNGLRIFLFYLLLMLAYLVVSLTVTLVLGGVIVVTLGNGGMGILALGVISGIVGAIASVLMTAILASMHGQFADHGGGSVGDVFE